MAIKGTAGFLEQSAVALPQGDMTVMGWFRILGTVGGSPAWWEVADAGGLNYIIVGTFASGGQQKTYLELGDGSSFPSDLGTGLSVSDSKWYHVALTRSGTSFKVYLSDEGGATYDVVEDLSLTLTISAAWDEMLLSGVSSYSRAQVKIWTAVLSTAEIRAERDSYDACRTANLWLNTYLQVHTDLTDSSGNGRHWTNSASGLSTVTGPDIAENGCGAPAPTSGELMGATPEPCCGDGGGGVSATGPMLPAVDPTWTAACAGGGAVPTASDLTDAENWDD